MKVIKNLEELESVLGSDRKEIIITTYTEPKLKKKDNPFIGVKKVNVRKVIINYNYVNDVNLQRLKENKELDFIPKIKDWKKPIPGTYITEYKDHNYIRFEVVKDIKKYYVDINRMVLSEDQVRPFLPKNYNNQGLDKPIIINRCDINNLKEINVDGVDYLVSI
jgi:hypothetical protein